MKKLISIIASFILTTSIFAQNEKQERDLPSFNQVEVSGTVTVIIVQGEQQKVNVIARPEAFEKIVTEVKNGTLKISDKGIAEGDKKVEIILPELIRIKQTGATVVKSNGSFKSPSLEVETSGASLTSLNIETEVFSVNVSGAGEVRAKGSTTNLNVTITGAGNLRSYDLLVQKADVIISGAGAARIDVIEELNAKISGAGKVLYKNEPLQKKTDLSGAGEVRKAKAPGEGSKGDTTKIRLGNKNVTIISEDDTVSTKSQKTKKHERKNHWAGIDLGVAGYLSPQESFGMEFNNQSFELDYARSRTWNVNFLEKNLKLYKNYIGVVTGMGLSFNRYHFNNRQTALVPFTDSTYMVQTNLITRKHLLSVSYLTVPLLLEFNTHRNPDKSFHVATGVIGGYRIGSKAIQVNEFDGTKSRLAIRDDFNLAPFILNATVRFGFGNLNLFATYALTEMFINGRGPELFPVSAGITLIGF